MAAFEAIFWDMDGTLVDTESVIWAVMQRAFLKVAGIELPQDVFTRLLGQSELEFFRRMAADYSLTEADIEAIRGTFEADYIPRLASVPPLPGAVEKVHESAQIAAIALVTGSSSAQASAVMAALQIGHLFRDVVASEMYERGKPDPAPFLIAAENLGVDPSRCLAIEDSPSGVTAARAAGMKVVGVHEGNRGKYRINHAHLELPSLHALDFAKLAALLDA